MDSTISSFPVRIPVGPTLLTLWSNDDFCFRWDLIPGHAHRHGLHIGNSGWQTADWEDVGAGISFLIWWFEFFPVEQSIWGMDLSMGLPMVPYFGFYSSGIWDSMARLVILYQDHICWNFTLYFWVYMLFFLQVFLLHYSPHRTLDSLPITRWEGRRIQINGDNDWVKSSCDISC